MHCLVIYAHPNEKSYVSALRDAYIQGLSGQGHTYEVIDLYKEQFNPALPIDELYTLPEHKHDVSPEILAYQDKIKKADIIAVAFPTWWQNMPAILKGFWDRVLRPGFAYQYKGGMPKGLLNDKVAVVINTYGSPGFVVKWLNNDRVFRNLKKDIFAFCGIRKVFRLSAFFIGASSERRRAKMLDKAKKLGENIRGMVFK